MGMELLKSRIDAGDEVVLVSQGLEHVMRPLAQHLGVKWMIANRLEFRDGIATGRLLDPVIRPRGIFARITGAGPDGRRAEERLVRDLGLSNAEALQTAVVPASRQTPVRERPIVYFDGVRHAAPAFGAPGAFREARHADRRDRLHRQSLAGEYADGSAGDRAHLSADPAAEIEPGDASVSKNWWRSLPSSIRCTSVTARSLRSSCANGSK